MSDFFGTGLNQSPRNFELGEAAYWDLDQLKQIILVDTNVDLSDIRQSVTNLDNATLKKSANLSDLTNKATARDNLGLGDAAVKNVVQSQTDTDGGDKVVTQGWMGLGMVNKDYRTVDQEGLDNLTHSGFFLVNRQNTNLPGHAIVIPLSADGNKIWNSQLAIHAAGTRTDMYLRGSNVQGVYHEWQEIHHTGNILKTTGNNDNFPMSQKAVTDALATKANISNPGSMGIGVGQTWQNMTPSRTLNTVYTNSSGRPIVVSVVSGGVQDAYVTIHVDGKLIFKQTDTYPSASQQSSATAIIPAGSTYMAESNHVFVWMELR